MDSIFHEKQVGQLCAQHCLNNLLQGAYFTAVDLASYARELDEAEKVRMAEGGFDSPEYLRFLKQPSSNMDDSGFFSGQVISKALSMWNLTMAPISSPQMKPALDNPASQKAFICNHDYHWLTVRKLGRQWFNLDSLQRGPKLISDTYLSLFLTQLQMEGYTIFTVLGTLPECEANQLLMLLPVEPEKEPHQPSSRSNKKHPLPKEKPKAAKLSSPGSTDEEESYALELATAMSVSMAQGKKSSSADKGEGSSADKGEGVGSGGSGATTSEVASSEGLEENERFQVEMVAAMYASMEAAEHKDDGATTSKQEGDEDRRLSQEEIRRRRLQHLEKLKGPGPTGSS